MIASLPMYDFPEVRHATDALWRGLSRHLAREGVQHIPPRLVHDLHLRDLWSDQQLFISQCCGYDVLHRYQGRLQVLGTPWFDAPGCCAGHYSSIVVVPEDSPYQDVVDMRDTVVVINGPESHSGMNALFALVAPYAQDRRFFSKVIVSGCHADSLAAIRRGKADVAAIDCHTYALLRQYRPAAIEGTRPLGLTYDAPAPPYVTRAEVDADTVARMQRALVATFDDPRLADARRVLHLSGVEISSTHSYRCILANFAHPLRAV